MAMRSSKWPWRGQSFSIQIWLPRSTIFALISPGLPSMRTRQSLSPWTMLSRTSLTHWGHSESVSLGKPSCGNVRSLLFISGAGAHFGCFTP